MEMKSSAIRIVLVVDDNEVLRQAVAKVLRKRGFQVLEASDEPTALNLIRSSPGPIDALVLDVMLDGKPSREIFKAAETLHPEAKVIISSSHPREVAFSFFRGLRINHYIQKPFHLSDLERLLRDALLF